MAKVTFTRAEIERTIMDMVRRKVVQMGFLPDSVPFYLANDEAGYLAARQAIIAGGKQLIDIFGIGSEENRGEKFFNRIFMNLRQYNNGLTSHWNNSSYEDISPLQDGSLFERQTVFGSTRSILYDIRSVTMNAEYDRVCTDAIMGGLTTSFAGYGVKVVNSDYTIDNSRFFLLRYKGSQEIKTPKFFERLYTYEVLDVWLDGENYSWDTFVPTTNIPPLTRIISEGGPNDDDNQILFDVP